MNKLIEDDLAEYTKIAGPEPQIDSKKPDLVSQYRAWRDWWWNWYQRPLTRTGALHE